MFPLGCQQCKPGVGRKVHLFVAPLIWTVVGLVLIIRGSFWIGSGALPWLLAAAILGTAKSVLVLDKTASRSLERIYRLDEGACLGAVYSWKTWILVAVMMASGITLRHLTHPGPCIGTLYVAIGWALLFSSRHGWLAWYRYGKKSAQR